MSRTMEALRTAVDAADNALSDTIAAGTAEVKEAIEKRLSTMVQVVKTTAQRSRQQFAGVNEEEILKYMPDDRSFSGIGAMLLGLLFLIIFEGGWKAFSLPFFGFGLAQFFFGYIWNAKIDVPNGYEGPVCRYGDPGSGEKSHLGRNWHFRFAKFIPFLVSTGRDQVVELTSANFTGDFASISLTKQITFRVADAARFIATTSPAVVMKIISLYASYIGLRMITSIEDARIKFTGRDRLDNVVEALNRYLEAYGIVVTYAVMPAAHNEILSDLEAVRTKLEQVAAMLETRQIRLEAAIKVVEARMRTNRKAAVNEALKLRQEQIAFETSVAERVNAKRTELLFSARKSLEEKFSELGRAIADFKARVEKAKAIRSSLPGLESELALSAADIRRAIFKRMMPKRVMVMGVEGLGLGFGMSAGNEMFSRALEAGKNGHHPEPAVAEAS